MFAVGYNYMEYKCFVDNIGGFEHWVGDMSGYISQTRETGFLDGAPSDGIFDSTLLMANNRLVATTNNQILKLNSLPVGAKIIIRKYIATHDSTGKIKINFSSNDIFEHPFYFTIDENRIEIYKKTDEAITTDFSVDTFSITFDYIGRIPNYTIYSNLNAVDPEKIVDGDDSTFGYVDGTGDNIVCHDEGYNMEHIKIYVYSYVGSGAGDGKSHISGSNDGVNWTDVWEMGCIYGGKYTLVDLVDFNYKYVKMWHEDEINPTAYTRFYYLKDADW